MSTVWDTMTTWITNNSGSPMTFSSSKVQAGGFTTAPTDIAAAAGSKGYFQNASTADNCVDGAQAQVSYSLNDGTMVNLDFHLSYYYGPSNSSYYTVGFSGARADQYKASSSWDTESTLGGCGKSNTWTIGISRKT